MRDLLNCLQDWLTGNRADGSAYSLLCALASETLKRADSPDPGQREFDAEALAPAAGGPADFESAKRWIDRAKLERFVEARRPLIEEHFRSAGHTQALRVVRRSPGGKHRAVWFLEPYSLPEGRVESDTDATEDTRTADATRDTVDYEVTAPGAIKVAWYARPLIGAGSFVTRSWRGLLWVAVLLVPLALLLAIVVTGIAYTYLRRPLLTSDLASLLMLAAFGWILWRASIRPVLWLLDDRIVMATELWVGWREEPAQLELVRDDNSRQHLRLVRYSAVCPICAGTIALRYSQGPNPRRLVGCCSEVPYEHMFSFDRVLRRGQRIAPHGE